MGVGSFASNARRIQLSHDSVQKIACNQIWRSRCFSAFTSRSNGGIHATEASMGNRAEVMIGVGLGAGLIYFLDPQTKSPSVLKAAREGGSRDACRRGCNRCDGARYRTSPYTTAAALQGRLSADETARSSIV
jgi:hypothetical protein